MSYAEDQIRELTRERRIDFSGAMEEFGGRLLQD